MHELFALFNVGIQSIVANGQNIKHENQCSLFKGIRNTAKGYNSHSATNEFTIKVPEYIQQIGLSAITPYQTVTLLDELWSANTARSEPPGGCE